MVLFSAISVLKEIFFGKILGDFFFLRPKKKVFLDIDLLQQQFYILINTPIASGIPRLSPPKLEVVKSYSKIYVFHPPTTET